MIRNATENDIPDLERLGEMMRLESSIYYPQAEPEQVRETVKLWLSMDHMFKILVAERDGEVVGFLSGVCAPTTFTTLKRAATDMFYVMKGKRSFAVARQLMLAFIRWAEGLGCKAIFFDVSTGPWQAERMGIFVERLGFKPAGLKYARTL